MQKVPGCTNYSMGYANYDIKNCQSETFRRCGNKIQTGSFRAGVNFLYETESNIYFAFGRVTFHTKRGA